ncbi:MAG: inositol monophosphatase family protein [Candidatus Limnocylindrales bacterium]
MSAGAPSLPDAVDQRSSGGLLTPELALATDAARRAGALQLEHLGRLHHIEAKGPRDIVTEADTLSEQLILEAIRAAYPDDAIIAEESGHHRGRRGQGPEPSAGIGRAWLIDPLDGTINYANRLPLFCVSIALAIDGRPALGVVYDPSRDELFVARAGAGATLDGRPLHKPSREKLSDCLAMVALASRGWRNRERAIVRASRARRDLGSAALSLAYVSDGRFDLLVQTRGLSTWDVAAAGLIAEEAGAAVSDAHGGPWLDLAAPVRGIEIVAAPPAHHAELLRLLAA